MEMHPGVFVSDVDTKDWQPDPEIGGGAEEHVLFATGAMRAGMSRFHDDGEPPIWELPARMVVLVLEGKLKVDIVDGPELEVEAGGMYSVPKGLKVRFHITAPFKELWVLADD
jgi:ethanolamine utilization protein EutQ (cupin superfamily)